MKKLLTLTFVFCVLLVGSFTTFTTAFAATNVIDEINISHLPTISGASPIAAHRLIVDPIEGTSDNETLIYVWDRESEEFALISPTGNYAVSAVHKLCYAMYPEEGYSFSENLVVNGLGERTKYSIYETTIDSKLATVLDLGLFSTAQEIYCVQVSDVNVALGKDITIPSVASYDKDNTLLEDAVTADFQWMYKTSADGQLQAVTSTKFEEGKIYVLKANIKATDRYSFASDMDIATPEDVLGLDKLTPTSFSYSVEYSFVADDSVRDIPLTADPKNTNLFTRAFIIAMGLGILGWTYGKK